MLKLRDIMTGDVLTLAPETTLRDAVDALASRTRRRRPAA
jgi:hypothetical protein